MKITILYFEGCPNHPPVVEMARRVVAESGLDLAIEQVEVAPDDVVRRRFLGSPTVQVDGVDIEPTSRERTDFAMSCRVYDTPDGLPPQEMLLGALGVGPSHLSTPATDRAGLLAIGGSVLTAVLSSACCWLPMLLLAFGASAAGASAFFERWRPVFIVVAVAMLALGFYLSYFRKTACGAGCCGTRALRGRRLQRSTLWISTVVVAAFILFPSYVGALLGDGSGSPAANAAGLLKPDAREYVFDVDGMHCAGCAATLQSALVELDGIIAVRVDYETKVARIEAIGDGVSERVAEAAGGVGYSTMLRAEQ